MQAGRKGLTMPPLIIVVTDLCLRPFVLTSALGGAKRVIRKIMVEPCPRTDRHMLAAPRAGYFIGYCSLARCDTDNSRHCLYLPSSWAPALLTPSQYAYNTYLSSGLHAHFKKYFKKKFPDLPRLPPTP